MRVLKEESIMGIPAEYHSLIPHKLASILNLSPYNTSFLELTSSITSLSAFVDAHVHMISHLGYTARQYQKK